MLFFTSSALHFFHGLTLFINECFLIIYFICVTIFNIMSAVRNGSVDSASHFKYDDSEFENDLINVNLDNNVAELSLEERLSLPDGDNRDLSPCSNDEIQSNFDSGGESNYFPKNTDGLVEELRLEEIRWFYKSCSNKSWVEFCGYDSLRIESAYRDLFKPNVKSKNDLFTMDQANCDNAEVSVSKDEKLPDVSHSKMCCSSRIIVRGGLYEIDLPSRKCVSIYWSGEDCSILRGLWMYENCQPLNERDAERIETTHLKLFEGRKISDCVKDSTTQVSVLHTEIFSTHSVVWYSSSPYDVYLYSQAAPSKIMRSFTQKLGGLFQKSFGYRLIRGYKSPALEDDKAIDISHLVFVIHGIGEKYDRGRIIRNTSSFRENVSRIKNKYFKSFKQRVEFFPVEWRSSLQLDGGIVEAITPSNILDLRQLLNSSLMDIMYYTSPLYSAQIQSGLTNELNRLYSMFVERNPNSNIKVSVLAHSLGCVIVYDIITGWMPKLHQEDSLREETLIKNSSLNFHLDNFFCLGSPLAVFLAMRFPQNHYGSHLFPPSLCNRLYNIFHPFDPVAYRLEPLVCKDYSKIAPFQILPYNSSVVNSDVSSQDPTADNQNVPKDDSLYPSPSETPVKERSWNLWGLVLGNAKQSDGAASPQQVVSPTEGLEHRLDYTLAIHNPGSYRNYLSSLTSHTKYWTDNDVAFFVLTEVFSGFREDKVTETSLQQMDNQ